ncbi:isoprenyl transferase 2 [Vulcanimicrobium alpinum]|uniref:Isoprenyl transferase n=1 Tax=Vulcanimicrobium alpinum TaxID=3016050 RepID=A0AAN2C865_UNVUL|nr:polyprenyl diphosphate synthase [Vulcanimicrobium alpinum]BDE05054.1 isoprenyl transferase 2 [Vulcanimicrobium alpinum]
MIERAPALTGAPRHVAIIMDGNRRWARARNLPALEGHRRGIGALERAVDGALRAGIAMLTVYAFSEENWSREGGEVAGLFGLAERFAREKAGALAARGVQVRVIGRRDRLPRAVVEAFRTLEDVTAHGSALLLTIAVDYGARTELRDACRSLARDVAAGRIAPEQIDEDAIAARLWTAGLPDPDLVVRTGGELRLSNFLLYQSAYAELWATPDPWPEFDATSLHRAIDAYANRERRFGR